MKCKTFSLAQLDSQEAVKFYRQWGYLAVRGLIPQDQVQANLAGFAEMLRARLLALGKATDEQDVDALYNALSKIDPESRFEFRRVLLEHASIFEFLVHANVQRVAKLLLGKNQIHINHFVSLVRIDSPNQDAESFHWHQDYPYNVMSRSATTLWAPLTPVTADMGFLKIVPGSHDRLLPVELNEHGTVANFTHHQRLRIWQEETLVEEFERKAVEVEDIGPGDALFFHSYLLHRSGQNRSQRSRWVFNSRLGDIADPELVARRWRVARSRDLWAVKDIHPDLMRQAS